LKIQTSIQQFRLSSLLSHHFNKGGALTFKEREYIVCTQMEYLEKNKQRKRVNKGWGVGERVEA
jgi:hypothetical protein